MLLPQGDGSGCQRASASVRSIERSRCGREEPQLFLATAASLRQQGEGRDTALLDKFTTACPLWRGESAVADQQWHRAR